MSGHPTRRSAAAAIAYFVEITMVDHSGKFVR
jgi:hypothetical protein